MTLAISYSRAGCGMRALLVTLETHLSKGLPGFSIVGLPEAAVKESKDRVRSAIINSSYEFPVRKITVNLAPGDLPKQGARFDLPIAMGILAASDQIPMASVTEYEFAGELALSGALRPIEGVLPLAMATRDAKRKLIIPIENAFEASLVNGLEIYPVSHLLELTAHFQGRKALALYEKEAMTSVVSHPLDIADVRGQHQAKRCLEIAAAGEHSLLMSGPPGTGKTMLASRLPTLLPAMSDEEALAAATVVSISNRGFDMTQWATRPFRQPHHTASAVALVGGGSPPKPGEISLSHHGVLFLDELPEFSRHVLETLREPLESGQITISRAAHQAVFPAQFQLICAMNPCPCGHLGDPNHQCRCTQDQVARYRSKLSAPFLDRIDMQIEVCALSQDLLFDVDSSPTEKSHEVRCRVELARACQLARSGRPNARLSVREMDKVCALNDKTRAYLKDSMKRLHCSTRAYHRTLRVARTIADLAGRESIEISDLQEALLYRVTGK